MKWRCPIPRPLLGGVVALLAGCAHEGAADRHFADLRDGVGKIEADQDRAVGRGSMLEELPDERATRDKPPPSGAKAAPAMRTVQIGDDDASREGDDPNDPVARPEIRLAGAGGGAPPPRASRSKSSRGRGERADVEERDLRTDRASGSTVSALDPDAKKAYDAAIAQVNGKQYDRALEALSAFLVRWPDHPYAENATYWRGECYFARGEYLRAAEQFEAVLTRGGTGNKAPDALLKIGMCHERLESPSRAREYWERLRRDYPRSDAARKIPGGGSPTNDTRGAPPASRTREDGAAGPKENR